MLTLDATQTALVAATDKDVKWIFFITDVNGVGYQYASEPINPEAWGDDEAWITGEAWDNGTNISSGIVITDFSGIELRRNGSETGIIAPSEVSFNISNADNILTPSDFKGGSVRIELWLGNSTYGSRKIAGWLFRIKSSPGVYENIEVAAEDFYNTIYVVIIRILVNRKIYFLQVAHTLTIVCVFRFHSARLIFLCGMCSLPMIDI